MARTRRPVLFTIGHSTRPFDALVALLRDNEVEVLVDVRRFPGSRRHPHFARAALEHTLPAAGIEYRWAEALGGRRTRRACSPHTGWLVAAFAGYADHMESAEFVAAATALLQLARGRRTAVMCAEARPEQCHRRVIADWCTANGTRVAHIERPGRVRLHVMPGFARVETAPAARGRAAGHRASRVVYDVAASDPPSSE